MSGNAVWFARRYPVGNRSNKLVPVSREGWLVVFGFVAAMTLGGLLWVAMILLGSFALGVVLFVVISAAAAAAFIAIAVKKSDSTKSLADYQQVGTGPAAGRMR